MVCRATAVIRQNGGGKKNASCSGSRIFFRGPTAVDPSTLLDMPQLLLQSVPGVQVGEVPVQPVAQPLSVRYDAPLALLFPSRTTIVLVSGSLRNTVL